jgi:flagellar motility protein MotE (MotC chaperone)
MRYDEIEQLRERHPAWALLRANNSALILSFLSRVFVEKNSGDLPAGQIAGELDNELYALQQHVGEDRFPRSAQAYLDEWAAPEHGWLRKFYPPGSDEPRYDITPVVEKALQWVNELPRRDFVGTESRLNTIFELLRQMVFGADDDPERRLMELRRRRSEVDAEIARAERGELPLLGSAGLRDRYQQFSRTARELLSDFREVEENFRQLDRDLRQQIAGWTGSKGELLDEILTTRASITDSDQGRSFQAFYDFLLSQARQEEFTYLLERLRALELAEHDDRLTRIHYDWIGASERTQSTVRLLSDQLRRFLDDQVWIENRRVFDLLRAVESKAVHLREAKDPPVTTEMDASSVSVHLPTERPLYHRPATAVLESALAEAGAEDFSSNALTEQVFVNRDELTRRVFRALGPRDQVGLRDVVAETPLEHGLAELITYLSLVEPGLSVVFDRNQRDQLEWVGDAGERVAEMPRVTFTRGSGEEK